VLVAIRSLPFFEQLFWNLPRVRGVVGENHNPVSLFVPVQLEIEKAFSQ